MDETREIRKALDWQAAETEAAGTRPDEDFSDIRYETADGIAKITIARPEVRNAFRPLTTEGADRRRSTPRGTIPRSASSC